MVSLNIRWNGTEFCVDADPGDSMEVVRRKVAERTGVAASKQKFVGLKTVDGRQPADDDAVESLKLKPGQKIMMMGTPEAVIAETVAQEQSTHEVEDDFDDEEGEGTSVELSMRPEVQEKLARRLEMVNVKVLNPPRPGKKLLVVDIDYTIFDLGSTAERPEELARPYLHEFFAACYEFFDLMIWSATSMRWVEVKMRELGVSTHPDYRLVCMLDCTAMVTVQNERYGVFDCKPLEFVWRKFPDSYDADNTVMLDDLKRNFVMNRRNGIAIRPYRRAHRNRSTDRELLHLAAYFRSIGRLQSLSGLDHRKWQRYGRGTGGEPSQ